MFVEELHFMTQKIAKAVEDNNHRAFEDLSDRLLVYEMRALTLFKDLDLSLIDNDEETSFEKGRLPSVGSPSFDEL